MKKVAAKTEMSGQHARAGSSGIMTRIALIAVLTGLWILHSPAIAGDDPVDKHYTLDIPSSDIDIALMALARESGRSLIIPSDGVKGKRSRAIHGSYTLTEALSAMLEGTNLSSGLTKSGVITISLRENNGSSLEGQMQTNTIKKSLLAGVSAFLFGPAGAFAQDQAGGEDGARSKIDEIIVTAARREQNVRDLAGSVAVLTGDGLEEMSAGGFEDYLKLVPGVQFNDTGASQNAIITIRGVSTSTSTGLTQQTVGIYIDETPFTDVFSFLSSPDIAPFDLERVEVLRGPQGALYGSGSMGGAIRYVTTKPKLGEFEGKYAGAGSFTKDGGFNSLNQGMANIPLGDNFAVRGVISYRTDAGYVDNTLTGEEDVDSMSQLHGRAALRWTPTDKLNVLASYIHQKTNSDGIAIFEDITGENPSTAVVPPVVIDLKYQIANLSVEYDLGFADFLSSTSYAAKRRFARVERGPDGIANGLAPYNNALISILPSYTPGEIIARSIDSFTSFGKPQSDAWFVEGRLTSKSDQRLRWLLGVLYTRIDTFNSVEQYAFGLNDLLSDYVFEPPLDTILGAPNAAALFQVPENDRLLTLIQDSQAREYAGYGELQFDVTDALEISVGGRYFDYSVSTLLGFNGNVLADIDNSIAKFQPRVTAGYDVGDDILAYFVFSRGYRVGGVNDTIGLTLSPGQSIEDSPAPLTYDTDNLFNYEIGVKSSWLDGAVIADVGVYYIDWSDIQLSSFFASPVYGGVAAISNVGDATIWGVEGQFSVAPNENLRLSTSVSWNDAELAEDGPPMQNVEVGGFVNAAAGTQLPGSRRWQLSNSMTLNGDLLGYRTTLTLSHQYGSATINDLVFQQKLEAYNLVDAQFDVDLNESVRIGLFGRNLLDARDLQSWWPASAAVAAPRLYGFTRPRVIGVSLSADF